MNTVLIACAVLTTLNTAVCLRVALWRREDRSYASPSRDIADATAEGFRIGLSIFGDVPSHVREGARSAAPPYDQDAEPD